MKQRTTTRPRDRILDGIGGVVDAAHAVLQRSDPPGLAGSAQEAITAAAGATLKDGVGPEVTHRILAQAVWRAGAPFLISPDDWPDLLPEVVLGAVRRAPLVNGDPLMRDLRADGQR